MKQKMISAARMTYGTRRLVAGDEFEASRRDARLLAAIGKARLPGEGEAKPAKLPRHDELGFARAEYARVTGKKPFNGWKIETLQKKIAAAKG